MKKLITVNLIFLTCMQLNCSFWDSITSVAHKVGDGLKTAGEATGDFFKNQVAGCSEVVGLGTAYGTATAALHTAKLAVSSAEIIGKKTALDSAQATLEGVEKTSTGVLTLANAIAKGLGEGFNITCIRFFGSIEELEFELNATILGKAVSVREKVDFSDVKSFVEKIFDALQDEVKKVF